MASGWAGCCAALPITGGTHSIAVGGLCQDYMLSNESDRIGVWNVNLPNQLGQGQDLTRSQLFIHFASGYLKSAFLRHLRFGYCNGNQIGQRVDGR